MCCRFTENMQMRKLFTAAAFAAFVAVVLSSCSQEGKYFKMEGRFRHINQGEFWVYSLEGNTGRLDTIRVRDGRIAYEKRINTPTTFIIIFPNYSEQVVFGEPGKTVNIKGDASHLKEMEVKGTRDNELMNKLRVRVADATPDERKQMAEQVVADNPKSRVGTFLVARHVLQSPTPDYPLAARLIAKLLEAQPRDGFLVRLDRQLKRIAETSSGTLFPDNLKAIAIDSTEVDFEKLRNADVAVVNTWASWNVQSMKQQRMIANVARSSRGRLEMLSIALDNDRAEVENSIKHDTITWPVIFDGRMFESPLVDSLGLTAMPDNIVMKKGKIVGRSMPTDQLVEEVNKLLSGK